MAGEAFDMHIGAGESQQEREYYLRKLIKAFPDKAEDPAIIYGNPRLAYLRYVNEGLIDEEPPIPVIPEIPNVEILGQYELMNYWNLGDSWADPNRVNITTGASPSERLAKRLGTGKLTHRGFSSRTVEDIANILLGGTNGWIPRTKALVTLTSCHLNNTKYLGTGPAAERSYKYACESLFSILTAKASIASNTESWVYSPNWEAETTTGITTAQKSNNSTGGARFRTTTVGSYALLNANVPEMDLVFVARKEGAGRITVKNAQNNAVLGILDLTGEVAQECPAILKLRNLGSTVQLKIELTSGSSLTIDSVRIPSINPPPIVCVPAADVPNGGGNTLPNGDPSRTYNEAQATARRWMKEIADNYPSISICDLNDYDFDDTDLYSDLRHLNDKGAAKWAGAVMDHLVDRGYNAGLNTLKNEEPAYSLPSKPAIPIGGQDGTSSTGIIPAPRLFTDSTLEWRLSSDYKADLEIKYLPDLVRGELLQSDGTGPIVQKQGNLTFLRFRGTETYPDQLLNETFDRQGTETLAILFRTTVPPTVVKRYFIGSGNTGDNPQSIAGVNSTLNTYIMNEGSPLSSTGHATANDVWQVMLIVRNGEETVFRINEVENIGNTGPATAKRGYRLARAHAGTPASSTAVDIGAIVSFNGIVADKAKRDAIYAKLVALIP